MGVMMSVEKCRNRDGVQGDVIVVVRSKTLLESR